MSASETTETYAPTHYVHLRTEVDAIRYDGTEHCRDAIIDWVLAGGGQSVERATGELLTLGARGWMPVRPDLDHVVRSIDVPGRGREFFPMGHDVLSAAYMTGHDYGAAATRDQLAAMVVESETCTDVAKLREWLRVAATTAEALR